MLTETESKVEVDTDLQSEIPCLMIECGVKAVFRLVIMCPKCGRHSYFYCETHTRHWIGLHNTGSEINHNVSCGTYCELFILEVHKI